jgi:pteridine reductase
MIAALLALESPLATPPGAVRGLLLLLLALALAAVALLLVLWVVLRRWRRRMLGPRQRDSAHAPHRSAWEEAGRRAEPATVDLDPSDVRASDEPPTSRPMPASQEESDESDAAASARGSSGRPNPNRPAVLVTGGTKRVGLAIAHAFAREGFHVIVTYNAASAKDVTEALAGIRALGGSAGGERLDLDDLAGVESFGREMARAIPRLDVLIHNASIYEATPLRDLDPDDALRHYRVNALAPLVLSRSLSALLERSPLPGGGAIVAMADMHVLGRPRRDLAAYSMSKAALVEMVRTLARELAPRIRVNAVAPGVVAFPEKGAEADPAMQEAYLKRVPLQRSGTPEDAAEVVRWLALQARYTTGEIIRVDGGRWLA